MTLSRFIVGLDLSTSNCALSYIDTLEGSRKQDFSVQQLISADASQGERLLPSFIYFCPEYEAAQAVLPFLLERRLLVGTYARNQSAVAPGRVISSAKSWLCHAGVDREASILPWLSEDVSAGERLSPVDASAVLLRYLCLAWNEAIAAHEGSYCLEHQHVVLTVPASFDEVSQRLTLEAAKRAGLKNVRLLEEPQAAFSEWLATHEAERESLFERETPVRVLVCDVGGGTSDFSLFELSGKKEAPAVTRIRVSDHILLGGDNIDLTLAHFVERKMFPPDEEDRFKARQWGRLVALCRDLKERVLSERGSGDEVFYLSIPAEGSSLFASSLSASLTRREIEEIVIEGFFPFCGVDEKPRAASAGLLQMGLPHAKDTAISRHSAAFVEGSEVDAVLFNGGTMAASALQERLLQTIAGWQVGRLPLILSNKELGLAVARGAAEFGLQLRKKSPQIRAGYARSVYLELHVEGEAKHDLICLLPQGFELGNSVRLSEHNFHLLLEQPVRFQLFTSVHRSKDRAGGLCELNDFEFHALPLLQTVLRLKPGMDRPKGGLIDIALELTVNDLGLLQMFCVHESGERWELEFNLRRTAEDQAGPESVDFSQLEVSEAQLKAAKERIELFYGRKKQGESKEVPKYLLRDLEEIFKKGKEEWSTPLLRSLWPALNEGITRRSRSLAHEVSWLYLAGWLLRPGYGASLDEWRINELWRLWELGLAFPKENSALVQWWIMWRRVAGGLSAERQRTIFAKISKRLDSKGVDDPELFRLAGSLELLAERQKISLGDSAIRRIAARKATGLEACIWALGRLGSRVPLYGGLNEVVRPEVVEKWFEALEFLDWREGDRRLLVKAFSQIGRFTDDRARDLSPILKKRLHEKLMKSGASEKELLLLREYVPIELSDQVQLFGESLPAGLRLR